MPDEFTEKNLRRPFRVEPSIGWFVESNSWRYRLLSTNRSHRGLGTVENVAGARTSLRLLDSGGIALGTDASLAGLAAHWSFDDGTAADLSANANNGIVHAAIATNGVSGKGFQFEGTNNVPIEVPHSSSLDFSAADSFTVMLWFKNTVSNSWKYLLEKQSRSGPSFSGYALYLNQFSNQELIFSIDAPSSPLKLIFTDPRTSDGQWHSVAGVVNRAEQRVSLYFDGVVVRSTNFSVGSPQNSNRLILANRDGDFCCSFRGSIDEVQIYRRALDAIEVAALTRTPKPNLIPEPADIDKLNWKGSSLTAGVLRGTNTSVLYMLADDKNANGAIDFADEVITAEYLISGTEGNALTLSRQPISSFNAAQSYGLASVNVLNRSNEVFFTGEPDGQVFAWTATGTNPMQRQLFSGHHAGKGWHAMTAANTLEAGEGLVGLLVAPETPAKCDVILWRPQRELPQAANFPQTAPLVRILPTPNAGTNLIEIVFRVWDAEGNRALPLFRWSGDRTNWVEIWNEDLLTLDGAPYSLATNVAASPGGVTHTSRWSAALVFTNGGITNIWLQARAKDVSLLGNWSEPIPYQLTITVDSDGDDLPDEWEMAAFTNLTQGALGDFDGDDFNNRSEYLAGTDPTDPNSSLKLRIERMPDAVRLSWQGGSNAAQVLQRSFLIPLNWQEVFTNPASAPAAFTNSISATNALFFQLRLGP